MGTPFYDDWGYRTPNYPAQSANPRIQEIMGGSYTQVPGVGGNQYGSLVRLPGGIPPWLLNEIGLGRQQTTGMGEPIPPQQLNLGGQGTLPPQGPAPIVAVNPGAAQGNATDQYGNPVGAGWGTPAPAQQPAPAQRQRPQGQQLPTAFPQPTPARRPPQALGPQDVRGPTRLPVGPAQRGGSVARYEGRIPNRITGQIGVLADRTPDRTPAASAPNARLQDIFGKVAPGYRM